MKLDEVQSAMAAFLCENGIDAMAGWPDARRERLTGPTVLVLLDGLSCSPAGMQDYLGQRQDESTGQWEELYGRRAQVIFHLDVLAPERSSAQECRQTANELARLFQTERPGALTVQELRLDEPEHDEKRGLLRLRCVLTCTGIVCTAGQEAGTFLDFTLRGDVKI